MASSRKITSFLSLPLILLVLGAMMLSFGPGEPWTREQLMDTKTLYGKLKGEKSARPLLISVGEAGLIAGAVQVGTMTDKKNLKSLRTLLNPLARDMEVVLYCGCCPFVNCPNIRPAFSLMNEMKFTNHKLLDIPQNLKVDWIDKGYPLDQAK